MVQFCFNRFKHDIGTWFKRQTDCFSTLAINKTADFMGDMVHPKGDAQAP
jgi:hypothetical protein